MRPVPRQPGWLSRVSLPATMILDGRFVFLGMFCHDCRSRSTTLSHWGLLSKGSRFGMPEWGNKSVHPGWLHVKLVKQTTCTAYQELVQAIHSTHQDMGVGRALQSSRGLGSPVHLQVKSQTINSFRGQGGQGHLLMKGWAWMDLLLFKASWQGGHSYFQGGRMARCALFTYFYFTF